MANIKSELKEKVIKEIEQIKKNLDSIDKKIKWKNFKNNFNYFYIIKK